MENRRISRHDYQRFEKEWQRHVQEGIITENQMNEMLQSYTVLDRVSFIKVLVTIGSILIGLGVLSFIASNWPYLGKIPKFSIILLAYLLSNIAGIRMEERYPKTGFSFIYLSMIIFGAGIFLIGQTFHFGGRFTTAFLLWAAGILPLAIFLKDKWVFVISHLFLLTYLNGQYVYDDFPVLLIFIIPVLYAVYHYFHWKWSIFFTNLLTLNFIWFILDERFNFDEDPIMLIFFVIGLLMYFVPINKYRTVFRIQGTLVFGIMGLLLTYEYAWNDYIWFKNTGIPIHIIFALLFLLFLLFLVRKENLLALAFIGITILRFYFDEMYDFLPKSIFFFICGLILLGFGFYFERKRKQLKEGRNS